jgi:hypothetical protein
MGTGGSFPGGKADHSPPSRAEVKNGGAIIIIIIIGGVGLGP